MMLVLSLLPLALRPGRLSLGMGCDDHSMLLYVAINLFTSLRHG